MCARTKTRPHDESTHTHMSYPVRYVLAMSAHISVHNIAVELLESLSPACDSGSLSEYSSQCTTLHSTAGELLRN